jgi:hypothetical protein
MMNHFHKQMNLLTSLYSTGRNLGGWLAKRQVTKMFRFGLGRKSVFGKFFFQATLTPTLSHWRGRGRIVGCPLENPAAGLAGGASAQPESSDICSFSQGERRSG